MPSEETAARPGALAQHARGAALLTPDGVVADADAAFHLIAETGGWTGQSLSELLPAARPRLADLFAAALADGQPRVDQLIAEPPAAGGRRWRLSLHPLRSQLGRVLGVDLLLAHEAGAPRPAAAAARSLRQQRVALAEADGPFRAVFEQAEIGIVLTGPRGGLVAANPGFCAIVGYSADELQRLRPQDLTHPDDQAVEQIQYAALARGEPPPSVEKRYIRKDGTAVWARITRSLIRAPDGEVQFGIMLVQNVTDMRQAEAAQRRSYEAAERARRAAEQAADRAERLLILTAALSRALTPEGVASVALAAGLGAMGADFGTMVMLDDDRATLRMIGSSGLDEATAVRWGRFPLVAATPLSDAARRAEPVWLENSAARERLYPHLARDYPTDGERAWAALPLVLGQDLIGALGLAFAGPREFSAEERTFLTTIAGLCAQALERARLMAAERAALAAADEALALLNTVVDSAPIGLAFLDQEFRYRRVNTTLAQLNRLPAAAHLGRRASDLFPVLGPLWERYWRQVQATGEPIIDLELDVAAYLREQAAAGLPAGLPPELVDQLAGRFVLVSYYPVRGAGGELLGVGVIVQDISARKRAEQERGQLLASEQAARAAEQEALARTEQALRLRDDFLSVAAHELKTPLTALLGQAQLLRRRLATAAALSEQNQRSLDVIVSQSQRLNQLITDMLDGARLEAGQLNIRRSRLDLGWLVRQVAEDLKLSLSRHQLSWAVEGEPLLVEGDAIRLEQVLQNLLSNAVKYSPHGGAVELSAARVGPEAVVSVRDEGLGVSPAALPFLFERFYRAPDSDTQHVGGAGVGLYVVKEIISLHGGSVSVESTPGRGSTFTVTLPLAS